MLSITEGSIAVFNDFLRSRMEEEPPHLERLYPKGFDGSIFLPNNGRPGITPPNPNNLNNSELVQQNNFETQQLQQPTSFGMSMSPTLNNQHLVQPSAFGMSMSSTINANHPMTQQVNHQQPQPEPNNDLTMV